MRPSWTTTIARMPGPWRAGSFSAASNRFSSDNRTLSPAGQSASEVVGADGGVAWARFSSFETRVQPRPSPNWAERLANRPRYPTSTRWFAVSTLIFRLLTARGRWNVTSVPMTVSASRLAMNTFEQTNFAIAAVADSSPSGGVKVSQPNNPKIPTSTIAKRNLNIFRTRRMLPASSQRPSWTPTERMALSVQGPDRFCENPNQSRTAAVLSKGLPIVVVECDGHEFHERTVQQASKDRRRDRMLQRRGVPILRFTGTDVVRGRAEFAQETADFIDERAEEKEFRWLQDHGIDIERLINERRSFYAPYQWPRI